MSSMNRPFIFSLVLLACLMTGTFVVCFFPRFTQASSYRGQALLDQTVTQFQKSVGICKEIYQGNGTKRTHHTAQAKSSNYSLMPGCYLYETFDHLAVMCRQGDRTLGLTADEGNFNFKKQKLFLSSVDFGAFNHNELHPPSLTDVDELFFNAHANSAVIDFTTPHSLIETTPFKGTVGSTAFYADHAESTARLLHLFGHVTITSDIGNIEADHVRADSGEDPVFIALTGESRPSFSRHHLFIEGEKMSYFPKNESCLIDKVEGKMDQIFFSGQQLFYEKSSALLYLLGTPYIHGTFGELICEKVLIFEHLGSLQRIHCMGPTRFTSPDATFSCPDGLVYCEDTKQMIAHCPHNIEIHHKDHHITAKRGVFFLDEAQQHLDHAQFQDDVIIENARYKILANSAHFDNQTQRWNLEGDLHCIDKIEHCEFFADQAMIENKQIEVIGTLHGFRGS